MKCDINVIVTKRDKRKEVRILNSKAIGNRLIELRGTKTQEEVASAVGISKSALSMYENGSRIPRDEIKLRLSSYYKKSVKFIFFNPNDTKCD